MSALQTWVVHLTTLRRSSIALGIATLAIAGLVCFVMVKVNNYSVIPMSAALLATALGLAIFVPKRMVKYVYALIALIFAVRSLVTGQFLFAVSADATPVFYWSGIAAMFVAAIWFIYAAHRERAAPPNSTVERDAPKSGARPSP